MLTRARDNVLWPSLVVLALLALAPLAVTGVTALSVLTVALIYAVGAVGLDVLTSYTGQFSFGQFVYFAVGAYVMSALRVHAALGWGWALLAGVAAAGVLAAVVGAALVRLRFFGSAVGTFFMGAVAVDVLSGQRFAKWTGGSNGLPAPPVSLGTLDLSSGHPLYYAVLVALAVGTLLCLRYTRVRAGIAARVVKQNEVVAAVLGVRVFREKVRAQVLSGLVAGLGGGLLAMNLGYLSPETFNVAQSIELFAIVAVGGAGSIAGPIIGAVFFFAAVNGLSSTSGSTSDLLFAIVLLVVVVLFNRGLYDLLEKAYRLVRTRVRPGRAAPSPGAATAPPAPAPRREPDGVAPAPRHRAGSAPADVGDEILLRVRDLSVVFGGVHALEGVSLDVRRGEVHAIIGPNGAGKTTFLNCVSGMQPMGGRITLAGTDLAGVSVSSRRQRGIARTFQHPSLVADLDVHQNVQIGAYERQTGSILAELLGLPWARRRRRIADTRAETALRQLEFPDARWPVPAGDLTMGEQKHVDIARAIAGRPRLLLLDEPTAGLGAEEVGAVARAIEAVRDAGVTILVIAHHVGFIRQIADRCTVLDFGKVLTSGTPDEVLGDERVVEVFVGTGGAA
jgi:branched-chain amino acid transport system permease protein